MTRFPTLLRKTLPALLALCAAVPAAADDLQLRVGWQKGSDLAVLKARGDLDRALAREGVAVHWFEFPAGPQMLEALDAGAIDLGSVGEAPPVFAQAAGGRLVYVADQPPEPEAEALLVPQGSPVRSVADLKGRRIVLNRGSNVHYLLVRLLDKAGLRIDDVKLTFLAPGDAYAAFVKGDADAWVVWDPYAVAAEHQIGARVVADAVGVARNHFFFIGAAPYVQAHPQVIASALREINADDAWVRSHEDEAAAIIAPQIAQPVEVARQTLRHWAFGAQPLTEEVTRDQQAVADTFYALKLIPRPVQIAPAVWHPQR